LFAQDTREAGLKRGSVESQRGLGNGRASLLAQAFHDPRCDLEREHSSSC